MKKHLRFALFILIAVLCAMLFAACSARSTDDTSPKGPQHTHSYDESVVPATCVADGKTVFTCSDCGYEYFEPIPATGHLHYDESVVPATCVADGKTVFTCSDCGYEYFEPIPATGHLHYDESVVPATCVADGKTVFTCSDCGYEYFEPIPATGHLHLSEYEVTVKATLEQSGELTRTCLDCGDYSESKPYSAINSSEHGVRDITLDESNTTYTFSVRYDECLIVSVTSDKAFSSEAVTIYISPYGATELEDGRAYRLTFDKRDCFLYKYENQNYNVVAPGETIETAAGDNILTASVPYAALNTNYRDALGNFAFFPEINISDKTVSYSANNPFVVKKYAETWLQVNADNNIYYDTCFQDRAVQDWTRPSFANHGSMFVGVIKEQTVEEAIIAAAIAEQKGAMGFDLHLNFLNNNGLLSVKNMERIFRSSRKPFLALFYDGTLSQDARLHWLGMSVQAGAAAVDMQGFMYHVGDTHTTQTAQNRAYWENLGYDMCFVDAAPSETVLDVEEVEKQSDYVEYIHALGGEVLLSAHVGTVFTARQALAYAEFSALRGVDVVKIVGLGNNKLDAIECVNACRMFKQSDKLSAAKVSYHLSGDASVYITRVLCPVFYGSYVAFCYPEATEWQDLNQLDLDMAIRCLTNNQDSRDDISVNDAISALRQTYGDAPCHPQLERLINSYNDSKTTVGHGYGATSNMSDRWTLSDDEYHMALRSATGSTNSFNMRAFAYDKLIHKEELWFGASITASMYPYSSPSRVPKVGVFIGTQQSMLAFVYNTAQKTIDLCYLKDYDFGYDSTHTSDSLVSTGLITRKSYAANVAAGDKIRMAIHKSTTHVTLYFAVGDGQLEQIASLAIEDLTTYFDYTKGACYAGALCELFMGSASTGKDNWLKFSDVSYAPA